MRVPMNRISASERHVVIAVEVLKKEIRESVLLELLVKSFSPIVFGLLRSPEEAAVDSDLSFHDSDMTFTKTQLVRDLARERGIGLTLQCFHQKL
jgi:hypothetical protein